MEVKMVIQWHGRTKRIKTGKAVLFTENETVGRKIGSASFTVHETQIDVVDMDISKRYRKRGFGRLIMMAIMALAQEVRKPIFLFATEESVKFYERLGLRRIWNHKKWNDVKVEFMNLNPEKKFCEQCSNIDFVWIPSGVTHIQLYM